MDPRVAAIRKHPKLGEGSCSRYDECYEDAELIEEFEQYAITTPEQAVTHCLEMEGLHNEREDDIRGYGNVSPLHSPRIPGHVYEDDPARYDELDPEEYK